MTSTGSPMRVDLRAVIASGFAVLAIVAAGNAAAMFVLRARSYGTLPPAGAAAAYAAAAAWCAVRLRAGRARSPGRPVGAWVASGLSVWVTFALPYRPGSMFWAVSAAALASWGAAGVWARRRLSGRGTGRRSRIVAPLVAPHVPHVVRAGDPDVETAGGPARAGVRPVAGA